MKKLAILTAVAATAALAVPATANARTGSAPCTVVHDHITKTDSGHGSPAEWADLSMNRVTTICGDAVKGYKIALVDTGALWTRTGAGTPNGTGAAIKHRVQGTVHGVYDLNVTGGKLVHKHGDVSLSSTEYVRSLFTPGATVTGGAYSWGYATRCEPKGWVDSSTNSDGQGAAAGNITGERCSKPSPPPTSPPVTGSPAPSPTGSTPAPAPSSTTPGEAPVPTPVHSDLPVTG